LLGSREFPSTDSQYNIFKLCGIVYHIRMKSTTLEDKTEKVGITLPNALVKQTDKMCGDVPRSTYIRRAIENYLKQGKTR
jgi:hypothetical protein